jgi:hypothetical protein
VALRVSLSSRPERLTLGVSCRLAGRILWYVRGDWEQDFRPAIRLPVRTDTVCQHVQPMQCKTRQMKQCILCSPCKCDRGLREAHQAQRLSWDIDKVVSQWTCAPVANRCQFDTRRHHPAPLRRGRARRVPPLAPRVQLKDEASAPMPEPAPSFNSTER